MQALFFTLEIHIYERTQLLNALMGSNEKFAIQLLYHLGLSSCEEWIGAQCKFALIALPLHSKSCTILAIFQYLVFAVVFHIIEHSNKIYMVGKINVLASGYIVLYKSQNILLHISREMLLI